MSTRSKILFFILIILYSGTGTMYAQQKEAAVQKKIQDKSYVFTVQSVSPMRGSMRQLTSEYDLRISPDSAVSYLPYFGRAFAAPIGSSETGIKFTSTNFIYTTTNRKKGGWDVTIKPRDVQEVQQLFLTIFPDGSGSLQVTSTNRDPISFSGYISVQP